MQTAYSAAGSAANGLNFPKLLCGCVCFTQSNDAQIELTNSSRGSNDKPKSIKISQNMTRDAIVDENYVLNPLESTIG